MSDDVNLRVVIRAMNEHSDTAWGDGWKWIRCKWQGRKKITVTDDGVIHAGGLTIRPEDRPLWRDMLEALDGEFIPRHIRGSFRPPTDIAHYQAIEKALLIADDEVPHSMWSEALAAIREDKST